MPATPMRSIRLKCLDCSGGSYKEVEKSVSSKIAPYIPSSSARDRGRFRTAVRMGGIALRMGRDKAKSCGFISRWGQ